MTSQHFFYKETCLFWPMLSLTYLLDDAFLKTSKAFIK